jgi:hypothetical protein
MNAIDSAVAQVLSAKQAAVHSKIKFAVEARRQDVTRMKGEMVTELIRATDRRTGRPAKGRLFDGVG